MTDADQPATCPNCAYPLPSGPRRRLCPNCQYPLLLESAKDDTLGATASEGLHKPTSQPAVDDTMIVPPPQDQPKPAQPAGPTIACPQCTWSNPAGRVRCERCAGLLAAPAPPPPAAPPAAPPRRSRGGLIAALMAVALVLVGGVGYASYRFARGNQVAPQPVPASAAPPTASASSSPTTVALVKVARKAIRAKASSTLPADIDTYAASNTLDGNLKTAWNSDGDVVGAEAKVSLTYTFATPVRLRGLDIANGFQKSKTVFFNNSRVAKIKITTDTVKKSFRLKDAFGSQPLRHDFGTTTKVVITITEVYRDETTKYNDCALSEVTFYKVA